MSGAELQGDVFGRSARYLARSARDLLRSELRVDKEYLVEFPGVEAAHAKPMGG